MLTCNFQIHAKKFSRKNLSEIAKTYVRTKGARPATARVVHRRSVSRRFVGRSLSYTPSSLQLARPTIVEVVIDVANHVASVHRSQIRSQLKFGWNTVCGWIGRLISRPLSLTSTDRTNPCSSGYASRTLPKGHWDRGELLSTTRTMSSVAKFLWSRCRFCRCTMIHKSTPKIFSKVDRKRAEETASLDGVDCRRRPQRRVGGRGSTHFLKVIRSEGKVAGHFLWKGSATLAGQSVSIAPRPSHMGRGWWFKAPMDVVLTQFRRIFEPDSTLVSLLGGRVRRPLSWYRRPSTDESRFHTGKRKVESCSSGYPSTSQLQCPSTLLEGRHARVDASIAIHRCLSMPDRQQAVNNLRRHAKIGECQSAILQVAIPPLVAVQVANFDDHSWHTWISCGYQPLPL